VRLLIHTRFHPSVGGIETVASLLANEWTQAGESVTVVTDVRHDPATKAKFAFPVRHRPQAGEWIRLLRSHDVFVHFNISLRALWPLLLIRRPFIAVHQGCYFIDRAGQRDWREWLKVTVARYASANIAASHAIARAVGTDCRIIPNPYDDGLFRDNTKQTDRRGLIFVGRLVSDKGTKVLIEALAILGKRSLFPPLTVVGDGPERVPLEKLARKLGVDGQVTFSGTKTQFQVADLLREHTLLVVPSLWEEPFGVVALEGIASGCAIIGSNGGGLPEAIGPCGITFPNGDVGALAEKIEQLLTDRTRITELLAHSREHLAKHHPTHVAQKYLTAIRNAVCRN